MKRLRDFTGGPVVKTTFSTAWGMDSISGGGTKIPTYLVVHGTTKKKKKKEWKDLVCSSDGKESTCSAGDLNSVPDQKDHP